MSQEPFLPHKHDVAFKSARIRLLGSLIGCLIAGACLYFFRFTIIGFALCIGAGVLICHLFRIEDHLKVTGTTISVVILISLIAHDLPPFMNAALRFAESVFGTAIAALVTRGAQRISSERQVVGINS